MAQDKFCILPFIHCHVNTKGKITPCCINNYTLASVDNVDKAFFNSTPYINFRELMLNNSGHKSCNVCYQLDDAGVASLRTMFNEKYSEKVQLIKEKKNGILQPIYLDIRFSNLCNFKCRTCWHGASSSWFEDAKALKNTASKTSIINAFDSYGDFKQLFGEYYGNLKELYFAGGEPLIMEEHYEFLKDLIRIQKTDIDLKYNTNLSNLQYKKENLLNLWEKFENVEIGFSIDHISTKAEIVRHGTRWEALLDNIKNLQRVPKIKIIPHITVSTFNVFELTEIIEFLESHQLSQNGIYFNILYRPFHYNIQSLTNEQKLKVKQLFNANQFFGVYNKDIQSILTFLFENDLSNHQQKRNIETKHLDKLRNESSDIFEIYEL